MFDNKVRAVLAQVGNGLRGVDAYARDLEVRTPRDLVRQDPRRNKAFVAEQPHKRKDGLTGKVWIVYFR